jgi:hypothetical protein
VIGHEARALLAKLANEPRKLVIPWTLPGRNELDNAQKTYVRPGLTLYAATKARESANLRQWAKRYPFDPPVGKVLIACTWRERTKHRDPDNIISGGRKFILDALGRGRKGPRGWEGAGLLHCDGWHCIAGFVDVVVLAPDAPGVEVVVAPIQLSLPLSPAAREAVVDLRGE